jgi:hypothetical protein
MSIKIMFTVMMTMVLVPVFTKTNDRTSVVQAYVNNGNAATSSSSSPPSINIMDWLPKNAFLPKANLKEIQQQLMHTVLTLKLDMETTKGVIATATSPTTSTTITTLDPKQEWVGWKNDDPNNSHSKNNPNSIRLRNTSTPKQKDAVVKSSHLLLQRNSDATPRLPIRNLQFRLDDTSTNTGTATIHPDPAGISSTIPMPGFNGQHPLLSSGVLPLSIQNCGEYVTLDKGVQTLPISTNSDVVKLPSQWEVIWKEQSPMGTIVCAMELQEPIRRNAQAMIPAGIMYLSFPVWDGALLMEYQKKKVQYDITAKLFSQERDMEIEKMTKSNNLFNKIMHYRNAFAAAENYSLQPHKMYQNVPTSLEDLIRVDGGDTVGNVNQVTGDDSVTPPPLYIVPKGMVRIVPTAMMKHLTQTAPCGKQVVMNRMLWSSSTSSTKNDADTKPSRNDILHGTAKIVLPPPSVVTVTPRRDIPKTEITTTLTTNTSTDDTTFV